MRYLLGGLICLISIAPLPTFAAGRSCKTLAIQLAGDNYGDWYDARYSKADLAPAPAGEIKYNVNLYVEGGGWEYYSVVFEGSSCKANAAIVKAEN